MKHVLLALGMLLAAGHASAQAATAIRDSELRADKLQDAAIVVPLARGATVRVLARFGGWVQVETAAASPARGWVRASSLDGLVQTAAAAALPSGRDVPGAGAVTLGIRGAPTAARWHAIVVTASPPGRMLDSLAADRASMDQVMAATAVQWISVRHLDGGAATRAALVAAIADVARSAQHGDSVLLHVASAGTRVPGGPGCMLALQLGAGILAGSELGAALRPVVERGLNFLGAYDTDFEPGGARYFQREACNDRSDAFEDTVAQAAQPQGHAFAQWQLATGSPDRADDGGLLTEALRDCVVGTGAQPGLASAAVGELRLCMSERIGRSSRSTSHGPAVRSTGSNTWAPWRDPADQWGR